MILNTTTLKKVRSRIALDIGNVLVHLHLDVFDAELLYSGFCDKLSEAHTFNESIHANMDLGIMDLEHSLRLYFPKIKPREIKRLKEAWHGVVVPCPKTLEVLSNLLDEGCEVSLLSNIGLDHSQYLNDICSKEFDRCVKHFSCYVGARKPTKLYYQSFIMDYPEFSERKFEKPQHNDASKSYRGLFLDDKLENIEGAKRYLDAKVFDISQYSSESDAQVEMIRIIQDI